MALRWRGVWGWGRGGGEVIAKGWGLKRGPRTEFFTFLNHFRIKIIFHIFEPISASCNFSHFRTFFSHSAFFEILDHFRKKPFLDHLLYSGPSF